MGSRSTQFQTALDHPKRTVAFHGSFDSADGTQTTQNHFREDIAPEKRIAHVFAAQGVLQRPTHAGSYPFLVPLKRCPVFQVFDDGLCRKTAGDDGLADAPPLLGITNPAASPTASVAPSTMRFTGPPIGIHPPPIESISRPKSSQNCLRCSFNGPLSFPARTPNPTLAVFGPFGMIQAYPDGATEPKKTSKVSGTFPRT